MMRAGYRIKPYAHERLKWVVRGKENGKWVRKYFEKKVEAETFAQQKNTELLNQGTKRTPDTAILIYHVLTNGNWWAKNTQDLKSDVIQNE